MITPSISKEIQDTLYQYYLKRELNSQEKVYTQDLCFQYFDSLLFSNYKKQDFNFLDWIFKNNVKKTFENSEFVMNTLSDACNNNDIVWIEAFFENLKKYKFDLNYTNFYMINDYNSNNKIDFLTLITKNLNPEIDKILLSHYLFSFNANLHNPFYNSEIISTFIEKKEDSFNIFLEFFNKVSIKEEKYFDMYINILKKSVFYSKENILKNTLNIINLDEFYAKDGYLKDDILHTVGFCNSIDSLNLLEKYFSYKISDPDISSPILQGSLNMGNPDNYTFLEEVYKRGGKFISNKKIDIEKRKTLFEDLSYNDEDSQLLKITKLMYEYEKENIPKLLDELKNSLYKHGTDVVLSCIEKIEQFNYLNQKLDNNNLTKLKHKI